MWWYDMTLLIEMTNIQCYHCIFVKLNLAAHFIAYNNITLL